MTEGPKLLVEWSSPWQEFRSAIRPALGRSPTPLAGEAPTGLFPLRGLLLSWGAEAIMLALAIILPAKIALLRPYHPPPLPRHEVIYFHGNELPRVEDFGGAQIGKSGRAGGTQAHHATQTIRVVRGDTVREKVVDAPNLKLPISNAPVENLLAFKPVPGPPPAEGLKPNSAAPTLSQNGIIAPAPEVLRAMDRRRIVRLDESVVAPPPSANMDQRRQTMGLTPAIIAPAPTDVQRESGRSIVSMTSPIIQPSPDDVRREPPPLRGPAGPPNTVVPPPVSAPLREGTQQAKLNMPAASVIAPPPSHVTPDRSLSGVSLSDPKVVPPPVQLGGRSKDPQAIVGVTAADRIVPPPPSVSGGTALDGGGRGQAKRAGGFGTLTAENVVPPPPGAATGTERSGARAPGTSLGSSAVVPPPPTALDRSGSGSRGGLGGVAQATIVPPPPSLGGGNAAGGRGTGNKGMGFGGAMDAGSVLAPPSPSGGNGGGKGVIASSQPGSEMGVPAGGSPGAIAMSPSGGDKPGLGGSGGGSGIGRGDGPGSGLSGEGTGAAKSGTGRGSDPNSRGGISPYPGPGGAGNGTSGRPPAPGVSVSGGSTAVVNLPSLGSGDAGPSVPGRSPTAGKHGDFDYTVEASSRSGGAFNFYGRYIHADKVYTKYIPTPAGGVVMQFGDPTSEKHVYGQDLTNPEPLLFNFPVKLNGARVIIFCHLRSSGVLREFQAVEASPDVPMAKIIAALSTWKFTPAMRGNAPVPVDGLLGFNIDTR